MRPKARWFLSAVGVCVVAHVCARFDYEVVEAESIGAAVEHCTNQVLDADETGTDCGGSCPPCSDGAACISATDCASATCQASTCQAASCSDGMQNQDETSIDCGGSACPACETCSDTIQNQDETSIDCGGSSCARCSAGGGCLGPNDCASTNCVNDACVAASCSDGVQNQGETAIDCGGAVCTACETCSDGVQNQGETGIDCGGTVCTACGVNTPPLARMTVTPGVGSHDGTPATIFQGDASATTDREEPGSALSYAWDWDNDGTTDDSGVTSAHTYAAGGMFEARLTVQDTGGLSATATFLVIVSSDSNIVHVTTAADEDDGGATPTSPGGTGLSLREAITFANSAAGRQSILVPAGFTIALDGELPSPSDALGVDIVGDGAVWDRTGAGGSDDCISMNTAQNRIFGFEIRNCKRSPLRLAIGATGSQFSRLNIHDNAQGVILNGNNVRFGPDNEVSRSAGHGVTVIGLSSTLDRNYIHDCSGRCIDLTGSSDGSLVLGNVLTRCAPGILFGTGADNITVVHNVMHANTADGVNAGTTTSGLVMQNNVFSANVGYGLRAGASIFAANDYNAYFGNTVGTCTACSLGASSLTSDPLYIDATTDDFRLQPSSPNIDTGIDTGNDVNGPTPGNGLFNGANPDIGAREAP